MRIYLDTCCLNRPYDVALEQAVRMEAEAILAIVDYCGSGPWEYCSSDVLLDEILLIPHADKRGKVLALYRAAATHIDATDGVFARGKDLEKHGFHTYDALHLASAEAGRADVLLTTDKRFINTAGRIASSVPVRNPLSWLTEVLHDAGST